MNKRLLVVASMMLALTVLPAFGQTTVAVKKIPWRLTVVVMDGTDMNEKAVIPVTEAVEFIEAHSRFVFEVKYLTSNAKHIYTPYLVGPDKNKDGYGDDKVWAMMGWNVPAPLMKKLPVSSGYLFLYKLFNRKPAQAGSSLGLDFGLPKGGKPRPYATIPTDMPWFVNTPKDAFKSTAAQIVTHELINTIQAKLEAKPYKCAQLLADGKLPSDKFEAERLTKITDKCYAKLGNNAN